MRIFRFARYALCLCAAAGIVAGGGGHVSDGVVPNDAAPNSFPYHKTSYYMGGAQDFKVPAGVKHVSVVALSTHGGGSPEGLGGRVHAVIPVTPGKYAARVRWRQRFWNDGRL
ncbi:MAG TPA: hypothetical protein VKR56_06745 [Candidatus Cybelea sp.]|nr:hypothetical protein [Candidatus Cybelea sp.]